MCLVLLTVWRVFFVLFCFFLSSSLRINSISFLRCPSILLPLWASLVPQLVKNVPAMQETGSIPGLGRSPGEGKGYPLQYSGLENSMDSIVHGIEESDMTERLSQTDRGILQDF